MTLEGALVLVTGGEGFIGSRLARQLRVQGAMVRVLARDPVRGAGAGRTVVGDVTLASSLATAMQGCDLVFHCAAAGGGPFAHVRKVNVDGTRNVMEAALQSKTVQRVVHVSSVAVHGSRLPPLVREDHPLVSTGDAYAVTKAEAERVAQAYNQRGLEVVVVRPTNVYGPGSATWVVANFNRVRQEQITLVGGALGFINLIYVTDLVDMLLLAATSRASAGECFFASGNTPIRWHEYLRALARLQGKPAPADVPLWLATVLTSAYLWRFRFTRQVGKLLPGDTQQQTSASVFSIEKARRVLGFEPRIGFDHGMRLTAAWLRTNGYLGAHPTPGQCGLAE